MIEIKLETVIQFHNSVQVAVIDFPFGLDNKGRQRCRITVEFSKSDIKQFQDKKMGISEVKNYYEAWLYDIIKLNLGQDWKCIAGYEEIMNIIMRHVSLYY